MMGEDDGDGCEGGCDGGGVWGWWWGVGGGGWGGGEGGGGGGGGGGWCEWGGGERGVRRGGRRQREMCRRGRYVCTHAYMNAGKSTSSNSVEVHRVGSGRSGFRRPQNHVVNIVAWEREKLVGHIIIPLHGSEVFAKLLS